MRVEPYAVGSYLHIVKRGARGMAITSDVSDQFRFLRLLYFMNDQFFNEDWELQVEGKHFGYRPDTWPEREPLVSILSYTLMPNHFHLLIKEIQEGGVSAFMQKLGQSMTVHFNLKYDQRGSIFQGSYRSRTISNDTYLQYVVAYISVKNTFELYPHGGLKGAMDDFEKAWKWAMTYPFSSLGTYAQNSIDPLVDLAACNEVIQAPKEFKVFAKDVILGGKWTEGEFE